MRRREFITLVGGVVAWPLAARAQHPKRMLLIGFLWGLGPDDPESRRRISALSDALRDLGWVEGKNTAFAWKYAVGDPNGFAAMAADLVRMKADVIVVTSAGLALLAQHASRTIPIVVGSAGELEGTGLISSVRRPGGNVTGTQVLNPDLMSKRVELLKELVPNLTRLGVILPITPAAIITPGYMARVVEAAEAAQIQVRSIEVRPSDDFGAAIGGLARDCQAFIVIANPLSGENAAAIAKSAGEHRLPAMYENPLFTVAGGLLSYGAETRSLYRQAATYIDKILRGANPGDLPVQQPTKFELVINLKAARAIGLAIPESFLLRADQVIE
jgi:putative tryptophan/tyrosine transport system substrate-binding protein